MDGDIFEGEIEDRITATNVISPGILYKRLCEEKFKPFQFTFADYGFSERIRPAPEDVTSLTVNVDAMLHIDWIGRFRENYTSPVVRIYINHNQLKIFIRGPKDEEMEKYGEVELEEGARTPEELVEEALIDFAEKIAEVT